MRIEQLLYLVEIINSGTFTAAADKLHVAQPSISQAIASLESELAVNLLQRARNGVKLTPAGEFVVARAKNILAEIDEISKVSTKIGACHTISIVSGAAPIATFLPDAISALKHSYPDCMVKIIEGPPSLAEQAIIKNEADLAIIPYTKIPEHPNLSFVPLLVAHLMALVNQDSPLASKKSLMMKDIQPHPFSMASEEYTSTSSILAKIRAYGEVQISLRTQNIALVQSQVKHANIVGLVYNISFSGKSPFVKDPDTRLIPIEDSIDLTFGILCSSKANLSPAANQLIEEIRNSAAYYQHILDDKLNESL